VFRAAVLSIVLTLAIGPNATLFCSAWCHPLEAKASTCQHRDATTPQQIAGGDSCLTVTVAASAIVREDATRGPVTGDAHHVVYAAFQYPARPAHTDRTFNTSPPVAVRNPLLLTALRI
jgi:hypothetical protein